MREAWPVYDAVAAPGAASFKPATTRSGSFPVVSQPSQGLVLRLPPSNACAAAGGCK
jgi:hypothetical protein